MALGGKVAMSIVGAVMGITAVFAVVAPHSTVTADDTHWGVHAMVADGNPGPGDDTHW